MERDLRGKTKANEEMRLAHETLMSLGRTLYQHRREHLYITQAELEERALQSKRSFGSLSPNMKRGFAGRIERGEIPLKLADLHDLSRLYEIDIVKLIYSIPREGNIAFQVLKHDAFMPVPFEIDAAEGTCYWMPWVRPRNSSLVVMKLQLQPKGHTSTDHGRHKEDEVVEVISGEAVVEFPELGQEISLSEGDRVHFKNERHIIRNPSSENEAWVFIYRELPKAEYEYE